MNTFTIKEAVSYGWQKTKEHFWFIVGVTFVGIFVPQILRGIIEDQLKRDGGFLLALLSVALVVVGIIFTIGIMKIFLKLYNNESADFSDLYSHTYLFWKSFFAQLLSMLVLVVGFLLLIVPGIILSIRLLFVLMLVVDKHMGPVEAIKESMRITKGHFWHLLGFSLVSALICIAGVIAFGVGVLVAAPVALFAFVYVYRKLLDAGNATVVAQPVVAPAPTV